MGKVLSNRVALVTGGSRGIGRAIVDAFAREGAAVAVAARSAREVEAVADECRCLGVPALALPFDVTDTEACCRAVAVCQEEWGCLDVLVNSAGIASPRRFTSVDNATWDRTLAVDLTGTFYVTRAVLPLMLERGYGRVITISSIAGRIGAPYLAPYVAAKHGVIGLMRALAAEYPRSGVTFNSVCPAYTDTPMTEQAVDGLMTATGRTREEAIRVLATPLGRLIRPDEVAALCVLLASPVGGGITGQAINVDGGQVQA